MIFILSLRQVINQISQDLPVLCFLSSLIIFALGSMFIGNDPLLVIRFFSIILFILLAYYVRIDGESIIRWFIYILSIQAIVVIGIEIYMVVVFGTGPYGGMRSYFLDSGFGDVYTYGSGYYKVQIKGNALLPVAFMLSALMFGYTKEIKYISLSLLLLVGVVFSGNFAFQISVFLFILYLVIKRYFTRKRMAQFFAISIFAVAVTLLVALPYAQSTIEAKSGGQASSMGTRYDQFDVLINDMTSSLNSTMLGKGLGNTVSVETNARNYDGYIYYELQTVYILNQLGPILFSFFILCNVFLVAKKFKSQVAIFIYALYCIYAASNPYMLDTNHVLLIIVLISFSHYARNVKIRRLIH